MDYKVYGPKTHYKNLEEKINFLNIFFLSIKLGLAHQLPYLYFFKLALKSKEKLLFEI